MNDNTAQTIAVHLQMIRDHEKSQAVELKRIADTLEAILAKLSG